MDMDSNNIQVHLKQIEYREKVIFFLYLFLKYETFIYKASQGVN